MSVTLTEIRSYLSGTFEHPCAFIPVPKHFQLRKPAGLPKAGNPLHLPNMGAMDIAEIELNVMTRQCLSRRIGGIVLLRQELAHGRATAMNIPPVSNGSSLRRMPELSWYLSHPKFDVVVKIIRLSIKGQHTSTCTSVSQIHNQYTFFLSDQFFSIYHYWNRQPHCSSLAQSAFHKDCFLFFLHHIIILENLDAFTIRF